MGEIRCGKRRILSAFALHKNSAFEIHTTVLGSVVACGGEKMYNNGDVLRELYGGSEEKSLC